MTGYQDRVLRLLERDPEAFMMSSRDDHNHVIGVYFHRDFLLGISELELRLAIVTMRRHPRKVWLASEVGALEDARVVNGLVFPIYRFEEPLSVAEVADYYGYTHGTVETYLSTARRHLELSLSSPPIGHGAGAGALLRKVRREG